MYGNTGNAETLRQHAKILAALKEAKADIYAICEVEQGDFTVDYLCRSLNNALGEERYAWLNTPGQKSSKGTNKCFLFMIKVKSFCLIRSLKSYNFDNLKMRYIVSNVFELKDDKSEK